MKTEECGSRLLLCWRTPLHKSNVIFTGAILLLFSYLEMWRDYKKARPGITAAMWFNAGENIYVLIFWRRWALIYVQKYKYFLTDGL